MPAFKTRTSYNQYIGYCSVNVESEMPPTAVPLGMNAPEIDEWWRRGVVVTSMV